MSNAPEFHPAVEREVQEIREWYEGRRPGLGDSFLDDFENTLIRLSDTPLLFAAFEAEIRFALMNRFPYAIYFRVLRDGVRILAVIHTARNSSDWQSRE